MTPTNFVICNFMPKWMHSPVRVVDKRRRCCVLRNEVRRSHDGAGYSRQCRDEEVDYTRKMESNKGLLFSWNKLGLKRQEWWFMKLATWLQWRSGVTMAVFSSIVCLTDTGISCSRHSQHPHPSWLSFTSCPLYLSQLIDCPQYLSTYPFNSLISFSNYA